MSVCNPTGNPVNDAVSRVKAKRASKRAAEEGSKGRGVDHFSAAKAKYMAEFGLSEADAEQAANVFLKNAGLSKNGVDIRSQVRREGGSEDHAQGQLHALDVYDETGTHPGRDMEERLRDYGVDVGDVTTGMPETGKGTLPDAELLLRIQEVKRISTNNWFYNKHHPAQLVVAAADPSSINRFFKATQILGDMSTEKRSLEAAVNDLVSGKKPDRALASSHAVPADLPGYKQIRDLFTRDEWNHFWRRYGYAYIENKLEPEHIPRDILSAIEGNYALKTKFEQAKNMYRQLDDYLYRRSGGSEKEKIENHFAHFITRDAYLKWGTREIDEIAKAIKSGKVPEAERAGLIERVQFLHREMEYAKSAGSKFLMPKYMEGKTPKEAWVSTHEDRILNIPDYEKDFDRHMTMLSEVYASAIARKELGSKARGIVEHLQKAVRDKRPLELATSHPLNKKYGFIEGQHVEFIEDWTANLFGYRNRQESMHARIWDDTIVGNAAEKANIHSALRAFTSTVLLDLNPRAFLQNLITPLLNTRAYVGAGWWAKAEALTIGGVKSPSSKKLSDALNTMGSGVSITSTLADNPGQGYIGIFRTTEGMARKKASLAGYMQAEEFAQWAKKHIEKTGLKEITREGVAKLVPESAVPKKYLLNDAQIPVADQIYEAIHAAQTGTAEQFAIRRGRLVSDRTMFEYGREHSSQLVNQSEAWRNYAHLTSWPFKEIEFAYNRLNGKGKLSFLMVPIAIGGVRAVPLLGSLIEKLPFLDREYEKALDGEHGYVMQRMLSTNLASAAGYEVHKGLANPVGDVSSFAGDVLNPRGRGPAELAGNVAGRFLAGPMGGKAGGFIGRQIGRLSDVVTTGRGGSALASLAASEAMEGSKEIPLFGRHKRSAQEKEGTGDMALRQFGILNKKTEERIRNKSLPFLISEAKKNNDEVTLKALANHPRLQSIAPTDYDAALADIAAKWDVPKPDIDAFLRQRAREMKGSSTSELGDALSKMSGRWLNYERRDVLIGIVTDMEAAAKAGDADAQNALPSYYNAMHNAWVSMSKEETDPAHQSTVVAELKLIQAQMKGLGIAYKEPSKTTAASQKANLLLQNVIRAASSPEHALQILSKAEAKDPRVAKLAPEVRGILQHYEATPSVWDGVKSNVMGSSSSS